MDNYSNNEDGNLEDNLELMDTSTTLDNNTNNGESSNNPQEGFINGKFAAYELVEISEYMLQYAIEFSVPLVDDNYKPYLPAVDNEIDRSKDNDYENLRKIVFGIYLCYMFYNCQPSQYVCNIHIQVRQLQELQRIMKEVLLKANQYEAMYCLYCLIQHDAFTIVPFGNDYTFKLASSRILQNDGSERLPSIKNFDLITSGGNLNPYKKEKAFKHMQTCHEKYLEMKEKFGMSNISKVQDSPNDILDNIDKRVKKKFKMMDDPPKSGGN
uniref:Mediator of RNA polymerase II transcription subunit 6 n=1 Tax=Strongyloides stercoralis TaxID=6248 RepID=A0A0K0E175_STRER